MKIALTILKGKSVIISRKLIGCIIVILLSNNLILSQNTSNTDPPFFDDSTSIKYRELNELNKYVMFKQSADSLILELRSQIALKDSLLLTSTDMITAYETKLIPNLRSQIRIKEEESRNSDEILSLTESKAESDIKRIKARKLGLSAYAGYGINATGIAVPTVGFGITYTFLRF